jgi:plastocyanin
MSWIPGLYGRERRPKTERPPAYVEMLETRSLLATVTVDVINFAFNPSPVTINVGDTVHWVWQGDNHSTTSVSGSLESWDSGVHNTGFTFDHTFEHAGTYVYYCTIHGFDNGNGTASGMSAEIVVLPSVTPPPPPPPPAPPPPPPPKPPIPSAIGKYAIAPLKIQATQFKTFHGYIAYFVEPHISKTQDFHAIINWGDGSKETTGHIQFRKTGEFGIISQHRYVKRGKFPITITVRDGIGRKIQTVSLVRVIN